MAAAREVEVLLDPSDHRLDPYRNLRTPPGAPRQREGSLEWVVIEGRLALQNALQGPLEPVSLLVSEKRLGNLADLTAKMPGRVPVLAASRELLEEVTGFDVHRGVLACARRPEPRDAAEVLGRAGRVAVLVGLGDLENTGAAFHVSADVGVAGRAARRPVCRPALPPLRAGLAGLVDRHPPRPDTRWLVARVSGTQRRAHNGRADTPAGCDACRQSRRLRSAR